MTYSTESRLDQLERGAYNPPPRRTMGWLMWVVVVSLSMNVFVIAFLALQVRDGALWFEVESLASSQNAGPTLPRSESLATELIQLTSRDDGEVIRSLDDERLVANGYRVQELALAVLRARGYQIDDPLRPLGAWPQPMSSFSWTGADGRPTSLMLFSGLGTREVQAVKAYLQEAAIPLTAEGIARKLAAGCDGEPMRAALVRTDEWTIFTRIFGSSSEEELLSLCQEMGPEGFSKVVEWGRCHSDPEEAGLFLISLIAKTQSSRLADWIASRHADKIVVGASDEAVLAMYSSLLPQSEPGVRLAMRILHSQRKLPVWQASQAYLARAASMPTLSSMSRDQALESLQNLVRLSKPTPVATAVKEIVPPVPAKALPIVKETAPTSVQKPISVPAVKEPPPAVETKPKTPAQPSKTKPLSAAGQASTRAANRQLQPYRTYVVKKGDTLWSIAKKFNVDVEKLKYLNGLRGAALPPGRVLRIPH
jgi:LysM repeat protein